MHGATMTAVLCIGLVRNALSCGGSDYQEGIAKGQNFYLSCDLDGTKPICFKTIVASVNDDQYTVSAELYAKDSTDPFKQYNNYGDIHDNFNHSLNFVLPYDMTLYQTVNERITYTCKSPGNGDQCQIKISSITQTNCPPPMDDMSKEQRNVTADADDQKWKVNVANPPCSWTTKCINSEGQCQTCVASPFAGDDRCVCGPSGKDWYKQGECTSCTEALNVTNRTEELKVTNPPCSWTTNCMNSENQCQTCVASPFAGDDRCVCGPSAADWYKPHTCNSCTKELKVTNPPCSWATKCMNSEGKCQTCVASPFAGDDRCVCGPSAADWLKPGTCPSCTFLPTIIV